MSRDIEQFLCQAARVAASTVTDGFDSQDHIVVLLALFNGERTIGEQLESVAGQIHQDWSIIVSDDGSKDAGFDVVLNFAEARAPGRVWLRKGPERGFVANFLSLIQAAGPTAPYAALCDHDDVWLPQKLARAHGRLKEIPPGKPALYASRTVISDQWLKPLRPSPRFSLPPHFKNALVQNIGGGNTMVLNRAALDLAQAASPHASDVVAHDWWLYQIVSGAGGIVIYDPEPTVLYRQHGQNLIGESVTLRAGFDRAIQVLRGRFRAWNAENIKALEASSHLLTPEARETLALFRTIREGRLSDRIRSLRRAGLYRQTFLGNAAIFIATVFNRL